MASLSYQIEAYLGRKVDFRSEILLQDDGNGVYIKAWNVPEPQLSIEQLDTYNGQASADESLAEVLRSRQGAYKSLGEQFDMQYWDGVNGTTTWQDHIAKVKADYPKV
jgi:hypothetical protein